MARQVVLPERLATVAPLVPTIKTTEQQGIIFRWHQVLSGVKMAESRSTIHQLLSVPARLDLSRS